MMIFAEKRLFIQEKNPFFLVLVVKLFQVWPSFNVTLGGSSFRYSRHDKRSKLPEWILSHLRYAHLNLSTDMAVHIAREFLRKMAQPYDKTGSSGRKTLLSQQDIEKMSDATPTDMLFLNIYA
ncbi:hypothetical protein Droror1_Dr00027096 [Drosera rotundifolia]